MCFNPFLANDSLSDSNQNADFNISALETNYLSPSEIDKTSEHQRYEQKLRGFSKFCKS